jgi:hypothetical protein
MYLHAAPEDATKGMREARAVTLDYEVKVMVSH